MSKLRYTGRQKRSQVYGFRTWLFHIWCEYEHWHLGIKPDGVRICGFEWTRSDIGKEVTE